MRRKPWWKQRNSLLLTITVIVAVVLFVVDLFGGFVPLELLVYDRFWTIRAIHQWDERVILVGYSIEDEEKFGEFPTDGLLTQVFEKVNRGNPTTVGLNFTRHGKPLNIQEREQLEQQMARMAPKLVRASLKDEYLIEPDNVMRRFALYRDNDYYRGSRDRDLIWGVAHHFLEAQGAKITEATSPYGETSISYPSGETVSFLPLTPSRDGGYHASYSNLSRYQVLISFPQELPKTFYSFEYLLNLDSVDFEDKIVIIGRLSPNGKSAVRTPIYQGKDPYVYLYDSLFIALGVSNFLQLPQAPFVAVWSEGTEFLYLLGWLLFSTLLVWLLSFDLRKKYGWLMFLFGVIVAWLFVISAIFIVSFSVFPKLWIPCGWIWLGTSANIVIGAFATLELAVRDEQKKVLTEQKKVSIEQKKALAEKTKRLEQEENYNQRLNQEIETLKNTLLAQERLVFLGRLNAGFNHEIKNIFFQIAGSAETARSLFSDLTELNKSETTKNFPDYEEIHVLINSNLEVMSNQIQRCQDLRKKLLPSDFSNFSFNTPFIPELIDLGELLNECLYLVFYSKTSENLVNIQKEYDTDCYFIEAEPLELNFVFISLLNNAWDALLEQINLENKDYVPIIKLNIQEFSENFIVTISDNGIAIPEADQTEIFDFFYTTKAPGKGTGLGLSLAQDIIVARYQGKIELKQEYDWKNFIIRLAKIQ